MEGMSGKKNSNGPALPPGRLNDVSYLSMRYRIPTIALDAYEVEAEVIALVPKDLCETHRVLTVSRAGTALIIAMADPIDQCAIDVLKAHTDYNVEPVIASEPAIAEAITKYYG